MIPSTISESMDEDWDSGLIEYYWEKFWKVKIIGRESKFVVEEWCARYVQQEFHEFVGLVVEISKYWMLYDCWRDVVAQLEEDNRLFIEKCFGEYWDVMLEEYVKYRWIQGIFEKQVMSVRIVQYDGIIFKEIHCYRGRD